jgi:hypothetical protein
VPAGDDVRTPGVPGRKRSPGRRGSVKLEVEFGDRDADVKNC